MSISAGFGSVLRRFREGRSLTQEELADRSGLAVNAISALERGVRQRPQPHTVRVLAQALDLDDRDRAELVGAVPARRTSPAPDASPPTSALVGRDAELEQVCGLVRSGDHRLVTLTGPGGVGKTSLAHEVVARVRGGFAQGSVFVDLSAVRDPARVPAVLVTALGIPERPGVSPAEALVEYLGPRRQLLVLDNLEQLLPAAPAVADLVARCPDVVVLATSRAPLRVRAEREVVIAPLEVPDPWAAGDLSAVAGSPAVRMLLGRAEAMGAPMAVTADNAETLAAICWRVDGLPLALELAAARARVLGPADLLARLDEAISAGGLRDLPDRQQTVTATLDWSQALLTAPQRRLFARLALFRNGFGLDAAEAVAGEPDVLEHLVALVEQSLVTRLPADQSGASRYRMLEPVRQYASGRLAADGDATAARDRYAAHFARVAAAARPRLRGSGLATELDCLDLEHANLRAAFDRLVETGRTAAAVALAWDLWLFVALRGGVREWLDRLDRLDAASLDEVERIRWSAARGVLSYVAGDLAFAQHGLQAAAAAAVTEDPVVAAEVCALNALVAVFVGAPFDVPDEVAARTPEARWSHTLLDAAEGQRVLLAGDLQGAEETLGAAVRAARETENPFTLALTLNMRATVAEREGDLAATASMLAESVTTSVTAGMGWPLLYSLPALASVAARLHEWDAAATLFGAATSLTGFPTRPGRVPASRSEAARDADSVRDALGDTAFAAAFEQGRVLERPEIGALAARLMHLARE